jgi:hypothetical protein
MNVYDQAIAHLEQQRGLIDAALVNLRAIVGSPSGVPVQSSPAPGPGYVVVPRRAPAAKAPKTASAAGDLQARILKALDTGPKACAWLAMTLDASAYLVKSRLIALANQKLVHPTGTGRGQMWTLGAKSASRPAVPAKEAV